MRFLAATGALMLCCLLTPALADNGMPTDPAQSPEALQKAYARYVSRQYRLGPNDVISLRVQEAPEFDQKNVLIAPDGNVSVAPFGTVNLAGLTVDEVQQELTDRLKKYLNDPKVQISLEHTKPCRVNVIGAVLRPGPCEMVTDALRNMVAANNGNNMLLERKAPLLSNVLVAAGGVKESADLEHVRITNRFDQSQVEVNVLALIADGDSSQDIFLQPGDTVQVPSLPVQGNQQTVMNDKTYRTVAGSTAYQKAIPVKVYGYVNRPGLVLLAASQSANLNSAIAKAGGFLNEAPYPTTHVYLSRADVNGHLRTVSIDPRQSDTLLRPNDVIYVSDKIVPKIGRAFDYLGRLVRPLNSLASSYDALFYGAGFGPGVGKLPGATGGDCHRILCEDDPPGPRSELKQMDKMSW